jgi:activating signal cointegrator complex subunit 3
MNAEIVAGTITSKQDAMDYVTWTYFFRRLLMNPSYYQLEEATKDSVNGFLSRLVSGALAELEGSHCIEFEEVSKKGIKTVLKCRMLLLSLSLSLSLSLG